MDVLILLDKLDDLIYSSKPIPLTDQVRVEREEAYSLLDQIRLAMPEEIKRARSMVKEREPMSPELSSAARQEDRHLQEIADSIEELKRSQRPSPPPLTAAAAEKVRAIIEAAEASAAEVRAEAEREARRVEAEAAQRGMEMRKRSAAEAAARLKRADEVTAALLAEAASASADIEGLLDRVRGPAAALADVLGDGAKRVDAEFARMRARVVEAPVDDDWDAQADPKGEIVARRDGARARAGSAETEEPEAAEEDTDRSEEVSQPTEEWSVEEALRAEAELGGDTIHAQAPEPRSELAAKRVTRTGGTAGETESAVEPRAHRFERSEAPSHHRA